MSIKNTKVTERVVFLFRAEVLNLLNHPSFQKSEHVNLHHHHRARTATTGQISATDSQPRQIQLSLQILF